jgi:DNA repair photolyase
VGAEPYRGCTHACEYCYARKYQRHLELGAGDEFSSVIFVKTTLPGVLARELARPSWSRETVAIGTATDPYQPIEGHYKITRRCLEALIAARTPFSIVTKGPMVVRDNGPAPAGGGGIRLPRLSERAFSRGQRLGRPRTRHRRRPAQRLRAARALRDAGIDAGVLMMPLVPGLTTSRSSIERTVAAIAESGVPLCGSDVARLDEGVRQHFFRVSRAGLSRAAGGLRAALPPRVRAGRLHGPRESDRP